MEVSFEPYESSPSSCSPKEDKLRKLLLRNRQEYENNNSNVIQVDPGGPGPAVWAVPDSGINGEAERQTSGTRQSVGGHEDVPFTTTIRKSPKRPPAKPRYEIGGGKHLPSRFNAKYKDKVKSQPQPQSKSKFNFNFDYDFNFNFNFFRNFNKEKLLNFLVIPAWGFCFFLLLRLIFTDRGVLDFHSRMSVLSNKKLEHSLMKEDNLALNREIKLIRNNKSYQKKLVRDHLGFIGADEYLILFAKVKKKSPI